jgi:dihydroorotate dehydrogenase (NAD+) catalytic subunit
MKEPDISVDLCGISLKNPLILASGILGISKNLLMRVADAGAGAVTIKSVSPEPREGHHGPTIIAYEAGLLNAVGYSNPGAEGAAEEFAGIGDLGIPSIASVVASEIDDFAPVVEKLMPCGFAAVELPLSCPHTPGYGVLAGHSTPEATEEITRSVRAVTDKPIFVKISPNVPAIGDLVLAAIEGGADAISAVNTLGPGMIINVDAARPVLNFKVGGVSGPALRPVAVRCVFDAYQAIQKAGKDIPIIGIGGVASGRDVLEMTMAGATAVGIGTAVYTDGFAAFEQIARETAEYCRKLNVNSLKQVRGIAHG